ncbi:MAG: hypothetical protein QG656_991 [Candidatus Hydrogenedentes bacterium]|nr:hypothetical protein [Candidatus Hydrogenedentota bacterium]
MELVFDQALVEEEVNGRRVMRLKKHQVLMRLSHPVMRQALATLSKELHAPSGRPRPRLPLDSRLCASRRFRGAAGVPLHRDGYQRTPRTIA